MYHWHKSKIFQLLEGNLLVLSSILYFAGGSLLGVYYNLKKIQKFKNPPSHCIIYVLTPMIFCCEVKYLFLKKEKYLLDQNIFIPAIDNWLMSHSLSLSAFDQIIKINKKQFFLQNFYPLWENYFGCFKFWGCRIIQLVHSTDSLSMQKFILFWQAMKIIYEVTLNHFCSVLQTF